MKKAIVALLLVAAACSDGGPDRPDATDLAGAWEVTFVIGTLEADPGVTQALLPDRDAEYVEIWQFEACDDTGCTLHRPDGGLLLGDLDNVRVAFADDDATDLTAEAEAAEPLAEGGTGAGPCEGVDTDRWTVRLDLGVDDRVLSGSVLRQAHERRLEVGTETCFGIDLGLGFSGVPAGGTAEGQG